MVAGYVNFQGPTATTMGWDVYVARFSPEGAPLWQRFYGRPKDNPANDEEHFTDEYPQQVYANHDGSITVTGTVWYSHKGDCVYHGYSSGMVLVVDGDGNRLDDFVVVGGNTASDIRVHQTSDGGFLTTQVQSFDPHTLSIQKYTPDGEQDWSRAYLPDTGLTCSGPDRLDEAVMAEVDDGYVFASTTACLKPTEDTPAGSGEQLLFLLKTDPHGLPLWERTYEVYAPAQSNSSPWPRAISVAGDGGFLISIVSSFSPVWNVVLKTDAEGLRDWAAIYGDQRTIRTVLTGHDGGVVLTGDGYDVILANLGAGGFLDNPCKSLPVTTQNVRRHEVGPTTVMAGFGPSGCNDFLNPLQGSNANALEGGAYRQVNACVPSPEYSPASPWTFADTRVGSTSSPLTVTLSNFNGLSPLHLGTLTLGNATDFGLQGDTCSGSVLYPANFGTPTSCTFQAVFHPASKGLKETQASVPSADLPAPGSFALQGTGTLPTYTLTTQVSPAGAGTVSLSPPGGSYEEGTVVRLTATPAAGYRFSHWEGNISTGLNPVDFPVNFNAQATAVFVRRHTLTTASDPAEGGDITLEPAGGTYDAGTGVTLTAVPRAGYRFDVWSGSVAGSVNPTALTMDGDKSVTARFAPIPVALTAPNGGEVWPSGGSRTITWTAPENAVAFDLTFTADGGTTWKSITAGIAGTSHVWTLPVVMANKANCLVKVVGKDAGGMELGEDLSDAPFTIQVVKILKPAGGEKLSDGSSFTINWQVFKTAQTVRKAALSYSTDGGKKWKTLASVAGGKRSYAWRIPTGLSTRKGKVRVQLKSATGKLLGTAVSQGFFSIR